VNVSPFEVGRCSRCHKPFLFVPSKDIESMFGDQETCGVCVFYFKKILPDFADFWAENSGFRRRIWTRSLIAGIAAG